MSKLFWFCFFMIGLVSFIPGSAWSGQGKDPVDFTIDVLANGIVFNIKNVNGIDFEANHPLKSSILYVNYMPAYVIDYSSNPEKKYKMDKIVLNSKTKKHIYKHHPHIDLHSGDVLFVEWVLSVGKKGIERIVSNSVTWQQLEVLPTLKRPEGESLHRRD